jgi:ABC-type uncharacterized transport system auxiliary subunit
MWLRFIEGDLLYRGSFSIRFYDDLNHVRSKSKDWETKSIKCPDTIYKVKPRYVEVQLIDKFTLKYPKVRDIRDKLKDSTLFKYKHWNEYITRFYNKYILEKFEDTKEVIRVGKSKKNRQHNV